MLIFYFFISPVFAQIQLQEKKWYKKIKEIPVPEGYERIKADSASFGYYLRNLPLKQGNNEVLLYDGSKKFNQSAQFAVIKMDVGSQDLQQCADAVMRLRGEYLFSVKRYSDIHFCFLSDGKPRYFKEYSNGVYTYQKFRKYMNYIFSYANTRSLRKELQKVSNLKEIKMGDVFIQSGIPYGHAVIVVDIAMDNKGNVLFMLAQSYMPAQEIHILKNPVDSKISPWYNMNSGQTLETPEWNFTNNDLFRF